MLNPFRAGLRNLGFKHHQRSARSSQLVAEKLAENLFKSKTGSKIISGCHFVRQPVWQGWWWQRIPNSITRINREGTELIATGAQRFRSSTNGGQRFLNAGNQRSAQPVTYAPVYNVTGVDAPADVAYIERSRGKLTSRTWCVCWRAQWIGVCCANGIPTGSSAARHSPLSAR